MRKEIVIVVVCNMVCLLIEGSFPGMGARDIDDYGSLVH